MAFGGEKEKQKKQISVRTFFVSWNDGGTICGNNILGMAVADMMYRKEGIVNMEKEMKRVRRERMYQGTIVDIYRDYMEFSNGNTEEWDYIHHKGAAAVVPVMDDGRILMVRQYRNALERFTLELPAGALDAAGEPGSVCSARELEEETGYRAESLEWLITLRTTVALCNERIEVYVARNLVPTRQHLDPNEFVNVEVHTLEELKEMIFTGQIEDSKTVASLLAYEVKYK